MRARDEQGRDRVEDLACCSKNQEAAQAQPYRPALKMDVVVRVELSAELTGVLEHHSDIARTSLDMLAELLRTRNTRIGKFSVTLSIGGGVRNA